MRKKKTTDPAAWPLGKLRPLMSSSRRSEGRRRSKSPSGRDYEREMDELFATFFAKVELIVIRLDGSEHGCIGVTLDGLVFTHAMSSCCALRARASGC